MSSNEYYHAHEIDADACDGRMRCMRSCPTGAIRVRDGRARMIEELCVDCGECLKACPNAAVVPLADPLEPKRATCKCRIAIPSPVLYSQFPSDVPPGQILKALGRVGFDRVFDVAKACDWGALAIRMFLRAHTGPWPVVSSFCPAVVRLIQVKYPDLVDRVLPLELPREITAREAKKKLSQELGVDHEEIEAAYITPCPAKVVSIRQPAEKRRSSLDAAIAISAVYGPLRAELSTPDESSVDDLFDDATYGSGWSRLGRLASLLGTEKWIAVSGMNDVTSILDDIENSRLRNIEFIEASACLGGCIGGPLAVENIYVARSRTIRLNEKYGRNVERYESRVERRYVEGYFDMENPLAPRPLSPLDSDIGRAIAKIARRDEIYAGLPKIDCGACGSPGCLAFAEDVVKGDVSADRCVVRAADGAH